MPQHEYSLGPVLLHVAEEVAQRGSGGGRWPEPAARLCLVQGPGWSVGSSSPQGSTYRAHSLANFLGKQVFNREHPASLDMFKVYSLYFKLVSGS